MRCFYDVNLDRYKLIAKWDDMDLAIRVEIRRMFNQTRNNQIWLAKEKSHDRDILRLMEKAGVKVEEHTSIRDILEEYLPEDCSFEDIDEAVKRIKAITTYRRGYAKP